MGEVVPLDIKPKTLNRVYKRHNYRVTYIPAIKKWKWEVEVVLKTTYDDIAETQVKAFRAAEKLIDKLVKAGERETGT